MSKHNREIFKVQIPLSGPGPVLAYNQDRSKQFFLPMTAELANVMHDEIKVYFWARVEGSRLVLEGKAPEQHW